MTYDYAAYVKSGVSMLRVDDYEGWLAEKAGDTPGMHDDRLSSAKSPDGGAVRGRIDTRGKSLGLNCAGWGVA